MTYIQYYTWGKISPNLQGFTEGMGDRSVIILDGRNNLETMRNDARVNNGKYRPIYKAYRIFKGRSFLDSQPITGIISL